MGNVMFDNILTGISNLYFPKIYIYYLKNIVFLIIFSNKLFSNKLVLYELNIILFEFMLTLT